MKVTFEDYSEIYGGTLPEESFTRLLRRVLPILNNLTYGRLSKCEDESLHDNILFCVCESVDRLGQYQSNENQEGIKSSETVGPWSVSYLQGSLSTSLRGSLNKIVQQYLGGTYLLCAWV